ncbi:MAG: hypothetical protein OEV28_07160 [Nitrospirota bacterium]|nr:hypothetical protein [Nitrospirota bacterium]
MVLWNRVVTNLDNAREQIVRWLTIVAERVRIEVSVAKILVEKGKIERRLDVTYRKIGERAFLSIESEGAVNLADAELSDALDEAREAHREMAKLQTSANELTLSGVMDDGYLRESNP